MAKCKGCGKINIFSKFNDKGLCSECARIETLKNEEASLNAVIRKRHDEIFLLEDNIAHRHKDIEQLKNVLQHQNKYKNQVKANALNEIKNTIQAHKDKLGYIQNDIENKRAHINVQENELTKVNKQISTQSKKLLRMKELNISLNYEGSYQIHEEEIYDLLSPTVELNIHALDFKSLRQRFNENKKVIQELLKKFESRYRTKTNRAIYQLMVLALEAELQNILYKLKYDKLDKSINDIKKLTAKYQKIASNGNQSIAGTVKKFIQSIEYLFIESIKIEYEYHIKKERAKEEQRILREQQRQEKAELKALEEERKKIEIEESKYTTEIDNIKVLMTQTVERERINQLEARLSRIQGLLDDVEHKKEEITTLQNGKAGYIYIISNLGSFGDNVFKVGMTRRLEPMDRVKELGDASVPFSFDVHSFIFSENAPELESQLHKRLENVRVNKVNRRKEFFNTTIDDLENIVYSLEPSAEFTRTMLAEHYNQSIALAEEEIEPDLTELRMYA